MSRRPTAFDLGDIRYEPEELYPEAKSEEEAALMRGAAVALDTRGRSRRWLTVLFAGLAGLILLAIGVAIDNLVRELFSRNDVLGWLSVVLTAMTVVALLVIVAREIMAYGFEFFELTDVAGVANFLSHPDPALLANNLTIAEAHFNVANLPGRLREVLTPLGIE